MLTVESAARFLLHLAASTEEPTPLTQMHLHKLLYYAQGWSMGVFGTPLFEARFEAWAHGPVVAGLYPKFSRFERNPIPATEACADPAMSTADRAHLESIWRDYGGFAAWKLREMTHAEPPWRDARGELKEGERGSREIPADSMRVFFRKLHEDSCRKRGIDPAALARALDDAASGRTIPWETLRAEFRPAQRAQA